MLKRNRKNFSVVEIDRSKPKYSAEQKAFQKYLNDMNHLLTSGVGSGFSFTPKNHNYWYQDVTIYVGPTKVPFKLHKSVLMARSEYFEKVSITL